MTALLAALVLATTAPVAAQEYTAEDTIAAIDQYSAEIGVSRAWLYATVGCETGFTFNPYSLGRQGEGVSTNDIRTAGQTASRSCSTV